VIDEPSGQGRGWELPIGLVLGVVAVAWIGWHERNVPGALGTFAFVAFVSVLFFVGRRRK
jgi:hypothetical protein